MDVLYAALAAAFVLAVVDYWIDLRVYRSAIAAVISGLGLYLLGDTYPALLVGALAGGFISVAVVQALEAFVNNAKNAALNIRRSR